MKEINKKDLEIISKRIDKIESAIDKREFIAKMVDSITDIELCENCKKVVMVRIGGLCWVRNGFFQVGNIKGRTASWCSDDCEKEHKNH